MARFVALYPKPEDVDGWEEYYRSTHVPLVEAWPDVTSTSVTRFTGTPRGTEGAYHLMVVVEWATEEQMNAALRSEAGMAAAMDAKTMSEKFGNAPTMLLGGDF